MKQSLSAANTPTPSEPSPHSAIPPAPPVSPLPHPRASGLGAGPCAGTQAGSLPGSSNAGHFISQVALILVLNIYCLLETKNKTNPQKTQQDKLLMSCLCPWKLSVTAALGTHPHGHDEPRRCPSCCRPQRPPWQPPSQTLFFIKPFSVLFPVLFTQTL